MDKRAPDNRSIGVFDSGMGGLTAVRRLHALMPKENIIYFGDTSRVTYGTRGRDTIVKYARQDVAFLRQFDLKAIVIACNTVSSVALDLLAEENNIPIIGTVEPACRRAMTMTKNGRVGVIGTAATMRSGAYEKYLHKKDGTLRLFTVISDYMGPDVTLIDSGAEAANLASTQFNPNDGPGGTRYYVSDDPAGFDRLAGLFLQEDVETNAGLVDISRF